mmetsp:Transcript_2374/g.3898  ORF Transcript_2374/g.3898 Transcript_2374/m.3898 type:complete len:101 (+) Transcript_2374:157-459(+)
MALTLLNYFVWDIPDAKIPFLIADSVLLVALHYVDRGLKAEKKLAEEIQNRASHEVEADKESSRAQKAAQRAAQKANNKHKGSKPVAEKNFTIQQPSKRD